MVAVDTDVLVLAFAFHRDPRQEANARFLEMARDQTPVVTIYSVMELLGQLSFTLLAERLARWPSWLQDRYHLTVLLPPAQGEDAEAFFQRELVDQTLERMRQQPLPFLDALILGLVERAAGVDVFVTWNARHFRGKTALPVLTPAEFLAR